MITSKLIPQRRKEESSIRYPKILLIRKPKFEADIVDKQNIYDRKNGKVIFKAKYKGKINNGFIAAEIKTPENKSFPSDTPNINKNGHVTSFCDKSINSVELKKTHHIQNPPKDLQKLNDKVITGWLQWTWNIPEFSDKGEYKVIIGIWETNKNNNKPILKFSKDGFIEIDDDDDSHHLPRLSI